MTKRTASKIEKRLIAIIIAAAVVSLLSIWSDDWFDIPGGPLRIGSQAAILVLAGVYLWVRKKNA